MPGIDESLPFVALKIAVLTVSDTRQFEDDKSGSTLVDRLTKAGHKLADRAIGTDDVEAIRSLFDTGHLTRPYYSINVDIHKRIRRLPEEAL